jgi:curved DNA-binding protein CbpA
MAIKTLYSVLGVAPTAYPEEIEDAYNRLKLQHPQAKMDADENVRMRFLALQQAYQTLSNPDARALYDQKIARAGVKVNAQAYAGEGSDPGWLSTRNVFVAGLMLAIISGTWVYHARQKAREEKEIAERVLRIAEEEKRRVADLQAAEEARRQTQFENSIEYQKAARERQFQQESLQTGRQVSAQLQNAERQAAYERQREQQARQQQERQQQYTNQAADRAAQQRLQNEKAQLRALCIQRYNRTDC